MTNKMAIRYLSPVKSLMKKLDFDRHYIEALDFAIKNLKERPKGEWIVGEYMDCHSDILPKYTCPFCGKVEYGRYDFCHCGADMRGGRE